MNRSTVVRLAALERRAPPPSSSEWLLPLGACLSLAHRALLGDPPPREEPFTFDDFLADLGDLAAHLGLDCENHDLRDLLDRAEDALEAGPAGPFHSRALWDAKELRRSYPKEFGR